MTSGAAGAGAQPLGGGQPVDPRHPDVHEHDVGRVLRPRPPAPLRRRRPRPRARSRSAPAEHHRQRRPGPAGRRRTTQDAHRSSPHHPLPYRRMPATAARRAAGTRPPPSGRAPAGRPPGRRARPARPGRCRAPGMRRRGGSPTGGRGLLTSTLEAAGRLAPSTRPGRRRCPARACGRWSAPPARCGRRCGRSPAGTAATSGTRYVQRAPACPAPRDSSTSAGRSASVGCGRSRRAAVGGRRAARRSPPAGPRSACVRAGPDHPGRPRDLVRRGVGPELQRAGVHAQQREPVGQHVVHLPGDPGALELAGLRRRAAAAPTRPARPGPAARRTSCRRARTNIPQATTAAVITHADRAPASAGTAASGSGRNWS